MVGSVKLPRNQTPVPGQNGIRLGHLRDFFQRFASKPLGNLGQRDSRGTPSRSASCSRIGRWPRRIRFSAIRYSERSFFTVMQPIRMWPPLCIMNCRLLPSLGIVCVASEYFGMRQIYPRYSWAVAGPDAGARRIEVCRTSCMPEAATSAWVSREYWLDYRANWR
jgi:hypothetical protein